MLFGALLRAQNSAFFLLSLVPKIVLFGAFPRAKNRALDRAFWCSPSCQKSCSRSCSLLQLLGLCQIIIYVYIYIYIIIKTWSYSKEVYCRSQTFDNMDRWSNRGGKQQRWEQSHTGDVTLKGLGWVWPAFEKQSHWATAGSCLQSEVRILGTLAGDATGRISGYRQQWKHQCVFFVCFRLASRSIVSVCIRLPQVTLCPMSAPLDLCLFKASEVRPVEEE